MLETADLLFPTLFPPVRRGVVDTLQVNMGYLCNQSCVHCHVNAGPGRKEIMDLETIRQILRVLTSSPIGRLDLTGGAPELNPHFRFLVDQAAGRGLEVIDRCNLTVLETAGQEDLGGFLARHGVHIIASLPCYLEQNVDNQRGKGVFEASIRALRVLNDLGYGRPGSGLVIDLVFNPQGPDLPPSQCELEVQYKHYLRDHFDVHFDRLLTLANMPIRRFGSWLRSTGRFDAYLELLRNAHQPANLASVMCRTLVSVDWRGYLYDCDFNQMLDLPIDGDGPRRAHISEFDPAGLEDRPIRVGEHCFGCTAGQGSGCGGALVP
jgi:radical SAM/Cys-rich protein